MFSLLDIKNIFPDLSYKYKTPISSGILSISLMYLSLIGLMFLIILFVINFFLSLESKILKSFKVACASFIAL